MKQQINEQEQYQQVLNEIKFWKEQTPSYTTRKEIQRLTQQKYYWKNKTKILAKQKTSTAKHILKTPLQQYPRYMIRKHPQAPITLQFNSELNLKVTP